MYPIHNRYRIKHINDDSPWEDTDNLSHNQKGVVNIQVKDKEDIRLNE